MQASIRRKLEAMERIRDFLRAHPFAEEGHASLTASFVALLDRVLGLVVAEQTGRLDASAASRHRRELRQELQTRLLRFVTRLGEIAAKQQPELIGRFRAPAARASNAAFLARSRDLVALAREHQELLAAHGLVSAQLDELDAGLNRFQAAAERANAGRRTHVGCRAELAKATAELAELANVLDPLVKTLFQSDAQVIAAWESARNVVGPFRSKPLPAPADPSAPQDGGDLGKAA